MRRTKHRFDHDQFSVSEALEKALSPATRSNFPNLSELFDHGIAFRNFYANFPMSAQSMGTMLTSLHPSFSPVLTTMEEVYDKDISILPSVLSSHGYKSALFMSGQLKYAAAADLLKNRGLDTIEDSDSLKCGDDDAAAMAIYAHLGDDCTAAAVSRWIDDRGKENSSFGCGSQIRIPRISSVLVQGSVELLDLSTAYGRFRGDRRSHWRSAKKLKSKGLLDQTVFVIVGDHGEAFGEHGQLNHCISCLKSRFMCHCSSRVAMSLRVINNGCNRQHGLSRAEHP